MDEQAYGIFLGEKICDLFVRSEELDSYIYFGQFKPNTAELTVLTNFLPAHVRLFMEGRLGKGQYYIDLLEDFNRRTDYALPVGEEAHQINERVPLDMEFLAEFAREHGIAASLVTASYFKKYGRVLERFEENLKQLESDEA